MCAIIEVIKRLQALVAWQTLLPADFNRRPKRVSLKVRSTNGAHFTGLDQIGISLERLFERSFCIFGVRLIEVNVIRLKAGERFVSGAQNMFSGEPFPPIAHIQTRFGRNEHAVPLAALLQPIADDGF